MCPRSNLVGEDLHYHAPTQVHPIDTFSDSNGAICMNYNPVAHETNKHVDLADHFAREQVAAGAITMTLNRARVQSFMTHVMVQHLPPNVRIGLSCCA